MNNIFAERLKKAMEQKNMKQIDLVKNVLTELTGRVMDVE